jgi:hypothetical protein
LLRRFEQIHEAIDRSRQYPDTPYWKMAARFGELELEAHLRWAEEALAELNKMAGKPAMDAAAAKEKRHAGK